MKRRVPRCNPPRATAPGAGGCRCKACRQALPEVRHFLAGHGVRLGGAAVPARHGLALIHRGLRSSQSARHRGTRCWWVVAQMGSGTLLTVPCVRMCHYGKPMHSTRSAMAAAARGFTSMPSRLAEGRHRRSPSPVSAKPGPGRAACSAPRPQAGASAVNVTYRKLPLPQAGSSTRMYAGGQGPSPPRPCPPCPARPIAAQPARWPIPRAGFP